MAVHNGMPYLPAAIRSVLTQTFTDFEFLIVDDGSTDETAACVQSFHDARIRLVSSGANQGQTRSLNRGLGLAHGAYIARLDADDVCLPDRLRQQVGFLDRHQHVAVIGTWMHEIDAHGRRVRLFGEVLQDYGTFVARLLLGGCPIYHPSSMFRREEVERCGGYDERFRIGQDYDLWIRLAMRRCRAHVMAQPLTMYRVHTRQQTIADMAGHRRELRLAHRRMVEAFCPDGQADRVARLLRADDLFWSDCASKEDVGTAVRALGETLCRLRDTLQLTSAEYTIIQRFVSRRIGLGVRLAPTLMRYPSWAFYASVGLLSPLLIPHVHESLSRVNRWRRRWHVRIGGMLGDTPRVPGVAEWSAPGAEPSRGRRQMLDVIEEPRGIAR